MASVFLLGVDGSMGRIITRLIIEDPDLEIVGGTTIPGAATIGTDVGALVGKPQQGVQVSSVNNLESLLDSLRPDVVVDFTVADATEHAAPLVTARGLNYVLGTTMLSNVCKNAIKTNLEKTGGSAVISSNMATGMNVFFKIAEELAKYFTDWDIEIVEAHHHRKQDSPSGTAFTVAEKIAKVLEKRLVDIAQYGRPKGPAPRKIGSEEIGIHSVRAGDIVGDHTVLYAGPGERIELVHRAHSRECFGSGAIKAIHFLVEKAEPGRIYSMSEVLGLE